MDNNLIFIIIIGVLFLIVIIMAFVIISLNSKRNNQYNDALYKIKEALSENLLRFTNNMNHDFNDLSDRLNNNLTESHKNTNTIFNSINERIVKIDEAQKGLNNLSNEVVSLQKVLTDKKTRGTFGEV